MVYLYVSGVYWYTMCTIAMGVPNMMVDYCNSFNPHFTQYHNNSNNPNKSSICSYTRYPNNTSLYQCTDKTHKTTRVNTTNMSYHYDNIVI